MGRAGGKQASTEILAAVLTDWLCIEELELESSELYQIELSMLPNGSGFLLLYIEKLEPVKQNKWLQLPLLHEAPEPKMVICHSSRVLPSGIQF